MRPEAHHVVSRGNSMTASEANRQRVLTLLAIERQQMSERFASRHKKSPAVQQGRPSKVNVEPSQIESSQSTSPSRL